MLENAEFEIESDKEKYSFLHINLAPILDLLTQETEPRAEAELLLGIDRSFSHRVGVAAMAGGGEAFPEAWKDLVRSLGTEQLVDAIYVALDDFNARERDTIPPELWRRLGDRSAAYKNPFVRDGSGSGSESSAGEVERIKLKLVAVGGEGRGRTSSDSSEAAVVDLLRALQAVPMTFATLNATNIGKTISSLRKHSSEKVRDLAAPLYKNWKALVDEHLSRSSSKPPTPTKTASATAAAEHAKKANTGAAPKPAPAAAPTKTASALTAAGHAKKANTAAPKKAACNKRKETPAQTEMDEAKLEAARKKLRERYREEETAKKQRKIQMINTPTPGNAMQRPAVVERRGMVRSTVVSAARHAPVASSVRT